MTAYQIEKGISPPRAGRGRRGEYPFAQMNVGDSFFVAGPVNRSTIASAIQYAQKRYNIRCCSKSEDGGVRVWRIE